MTVKIDLRQVFDLEQFLEAAPERTRQAASLAMNDVIGGSGLQRYRKAISAQINLPPSYLNDERFGLTQRATPNRLVAQLSARQRPTSLARFATSGSVGTKGGVTVKVKPSSSRFLPSAFLVRLNAGATIADDSFNTGLAIRLKPGQKLNKTDQSRMVHLAANVVLLYGPSIDQVLRNSVIETETPEVLDATATEFYRQFSRLSGNA